MTQYRKYPDSLSNWFDQVEHGVGKRGSTFTNIDAVSHDKETHRFLFREFKQDGESLALAQRWVLSELAHLPGCTVWFVRRCDDGRIGFAQFGTGKYEEIISVEEYRCRLARWWSNADLHDAAVSSSGPVSAEEIRW